VRSNDRMKRPRSRLLALAMIVAGLALLAAPVLAFVPSRGEPEQSRFGLADGGDLETLSGSERARYLDGVAATGAKWIRVGLYWSVIQPRGRSSYAWTPFDRIVAAARARGLNVLGVLIYTPPWARPPGADPSTPPSDPSEYARFAAAAAAHFRGRGVRAYEIWNEPNNSSFWAPGPDPARYAQLLRLAYPAIKGADSSATVVTGGLSPFGSYGAVSGEHMNPLTFLERMYASGARGSFDAVGWHPYSYPYGLAYEAWSAWSQMAETTPSARSIMAANGDDEKQIWPTEMGAPTGSSSQAVSEAAQARLVTDMYAKLATWSWAGPAFFYNYRDKGPNASDREQNFGLVRHNGTPKPALAAFEAAAKAD
jgi:polysaccharide biosynthesis protein PslG